MESLSESGLAGFWAYDGQTGSYSESEGSLGHSGLLSPGLSPYRTSSLAQINFDDRAVYQVSASTRQQSFPPVLVNR